MKNCHEVALWALSSFPHKGKMRRERRREMRREEKECNLVQRSRLTSCFLAFFFFLQECVRDPSSTSGVLARPRKRWEKAKGARGPQWHAEDVRRKCSAIPLSPPQQKVVRLQCRPFAGCVALLHPPRPHTKHAHTCSRHSPSFNLAPALSHTPLILI